MVFFPLFLKKVYEKFMYEYDQAVYANMHVKESIDITDVTGF